MMANIKMNKSRTIRIYIFIGSMVLLGCVKTQSNYNCGLAPSTPTDLTITNDTNQDVEVILNVKEDKLKVFKNLTLSGYTGVL
jgi:hypothetical protein